MPLPKGVALMPPELRAMLGPGEVPLAYEGAQSFAQASAIGGPPRANVGFSADPFNGGITADHDWIGSKVGGVSAGGAVGSIAQGFEKAITAAAVISLLLTAAAVVRDNQRMGGAVAEAALRHQLCGRSPRRRPDRARTANAATGAGPDHLRRRVVGYGDDGVFGRSAANRLIAAFHQRV